MPGDRFTEAGVARSYLLDHRVESHQVHAVPQGNNTQGSLEAAIKTHQELVDAPSTIITDPLHTLRGKLIARQLGRKVQVKGARSCPYSFPQREGWGGMLHEAGGLVIVGLQGVSAQHSRKRSAGSGTKSKDLSARGVKPAPGQ